MAKKTKKRVRIVEQILSNIDKIREGSKLQIKEEREKIPCMEIDEFGTSGYSWDDNGFYIEVDVQGLPDPEHIKELCDFLMKNYG